MYKEYKRGYIHVNNLESGLPSILEEVSIQDLLGPLPFPPSKILVVGNIIQWQGLPSP